MPFLPGVQEHRIWLVAEKKCLVAKKKDSSVTFAFAGEGGEDSSKPGLFIFVVTYLAIKFDSQLRS